jgi:hypothetical protein
MKSTTLWTSISILALLAALSVSNLALASGSYSGRPPRPPSSVDRGAYELGKKVFAGEFTKAATPGDAASQATLLTSLHENLPAKARSKSKIASYSGQLSDEQVVALQYFLKKRYKIQ